jgi:two-component system nitrate/nitrite response regulator NarL
MVALLPDDAHAAAAWSAGARGLFLRDANITSLVAGLAAASQGLVVLDPDLAGMVLPDRGVLLVPPMEELTPRELEVLLLLAEGLPNKAIASHLGISEHTVKFHVNAILGKLGAQSRTEAVIRATRMGLISL